MAGQQKVEEANKQRKQKWLATAQAGLGKNFWPELVGKNGDEAAAIIERENPAVKTIILREGSITTRDFRCNRVWVFVNDHRVVVRPPRIT